MYYWGFWSANHSRGHIWAVFSLEEHTALWLVRSYSHRCTPGHLWGNWEITWWKGASLTSIMNEIETCKDQTGPQHIPSSILAGCGPDIHVFGLKIESPIFFHAKGGSPLLTVNITVKLSGLSEGPQKWPLWAISRSCGYNMVKQFGIRVMEQARAQPGWCFATVLLVIGGHIGASKGTQRVQ